MLLVIIPTCVGGEGQLDVSSFAQGMLGGIGATNLNVELVATVARADDNGTTNEPAEGFKDLLAELLQRGDVLRWHTVIDVILFCSSRLFKLGKGKMG